MKTKHYLLLPLLLLFSSCGEGPEKCPGKILVVNPIEEVRLTLDGEPFVRDIFDEPPIFRHTRGELISISYVLSSDPLLISARGLVNSVDDGSLTIIEVVPAKYSGATGEAIVTVIVETNCTNYEVETTFKVIVENGDDEVYKQNSQR